MLKRFLLFAGETYYPSGGWGDFKSSHHSREDAERAAEELQEDWYHIVDLENPEA